MCDDVTTRLAALHLPPSPFSLFFRGIPIPYSELFLSSFSPSPSPSPFTSPVVRKWNLDHMMIAAGATLNAPSSSWTPSPERTAMTATLQVHSAPRFLCPSVCFSLDFEMDASTKEFGASVCLLNFYSRSYGWRCLNFESFCSERMWLKLWR